MIRSHRIRLNPTPEQTAYFARAAGIRRFVFNWGLAEWKQQYQGGLKTSARSLRDKFNAIKKSEFPWVYEVTKCAVEGAFMDLADAFERFFEGRKANKKVGFPKFKSKKRSREGFYLSNDKFRVDDHWINIPRLGRVNMAETLRFQGKLLNARITRTAKWWFVSLTVEVPDEINKPVGAAVGIDLGLNRLATLSDDTGFESQKPLKHLLSKIRRVSREFNRRQPGSHNREKSRLKLAQLHYRVRCIRDDFLHKLTTSIVRQYQLIGIEDLNVKAMMQNRYLAQALSDAAFGRFTEFLTSKALARGRVVQQVGRFFPSSKRCHSCHAVKPELTLAE